MEELFDGLYFAKLHDSGTDYAESDYSKFIKQLNEGFPNGILDFSNQQIGMSVLTKLTKVLRNAPHIRKLNFYGNLVTDHGLRSVFQLLLINTHIKSLDIGCNNLTSQAIPTIIDILSSTEITSLQLGITGFAWHSNKFPIPAIAELLLEIRCSNCIQCLGLSGIPLSIRQGARRITLAQELAEFIKTYDNLLSFSMENCNLTPKDAEIVFLEGFLYNDRLKYVNVSYSPLCSPLGETFCGNINNLSSLTYIDLSFCDLSDDAGVQLANNLAESQLIVLKIGNNNIGDEGFSNILEALTKNTHLTELYAENNKFGGAVATHLANLIRLNNIISTLNISGNPIGDDGAKEISTVIAENKSLVKLSVASCKFTDDGSICLANAIAQNSTLISLNLSDNFLTRDVGYELIDILRKNEILKELDLTSTQIDHFVIKAASDLCLRNSQIRREINLQPLKRDIVQLSIQRTKIPEALSRLTALEKTLDTTNDEIMEGRIAFADLVNSSNNKIDDLQKQINSRQQDIQATYVDMKTLMDNHETVVKDAEELLSDTGGRKKLEEAKIDLIQRRTVESEKAFEEAVIAHEEERKKIIEEIEEMKKKTEEVRAVLAQGDDAVLAFEPPQEEGEPLFVVDQVAHALKKKSSRSMSPKRSSRSKSPKLTSRSKRTTTSQKRSRNKK